METLTACYQCITSGLTCNQRREGCPLKEPTVDYAKPTGPPIIYEGSGAYDRAMADMKAWIKMCNDRLVEGDYQKFLHDLADLGVIP